MNIVSFALQYYNFFTLVTFTTLIIVALVNFVVNPYFLQNCKLNSFRKRVVAKPSQVENNVRYLPKVYKRQWRAYKSSGTEKPSTVFEFVKKPFRYKLAFLHAICLVLSIIYLALGIYFCNQAMIVNQVAYLLASVLTAIISALIYGANLSHAKKTFGRFVHHLNIVVALCKTNNMTVATDPVEQISNLHLLPKENAIDNAVNLLRQKGLDNPRTVDEQRKLNIALNNLLQSYANN